MSIRCLFAGLLCSVALAGCGGPKASLLTPTMRDGLGKEAQNAVGAKDAAQVAKVFGIAKIRYDTKKMSEDEFKVFTVVNDYAQAEKWDKAQKFINAAMGGK